MKFTPFLILLIIILGQDISAQSHHEDHDHHPHPKNEIGVGNYLSYLAGEGEIASQNAAEGDIPPDILTDIR